MRQRFLDVFRKLNRENRGVSLVELIVSILILAIIFTPVIGMFSASLKTNQAGKDKLYAETAANNLLEITKYNMQQGKEIYDIDYDSVVATPVSKSAITVSDGAFDMEHLDTYLGKIVRIAECNYDLTGYDEGTETYDAKVKITAISDKNNKEFVDMSAFNDTSTALINPSVIAGGFDAAVCDYYAALHRVYINSKFQDELGEINAHNNSVLADYDYACRVADLKGEARPPYPSTDPAGRAPDKLWPIPAAYGVKTNEEIAAFITKKMTIEIKAIAYDPMGEPTQFSVNSYIDYELHDSVQANGFTLCDPMADKTMRCSGYCDTAFYDGLSNIYVMYTPRGYAGIGGSELSLLGESLQIVSDLDRNSRPLNVFIVVQAEAGKTIAPSAEMDVNVSGKGGNLNLYSQVQLNTASSYVGGMVSANRTLISKTTATDRMFDVQITVYNSEGKEVADVTSTITVE